MVGGSDIDSTDRILTDVERVRTLTDLGWVLRQLRRRHARSRNAAELTVRELARRSGYAYGAISEYLGGKSLPPTDRFDVLIRLLGASSTEQRALATARDRVAERRRPRRGGGLVPHELPPDVYGFTGRSAELAALDRLLSTGGDRPGPALISAVAGTAGVGKTALAVHWAHRAAARFPDGCLYVDLRGYDPDQPVRPGEALAGFLRSLGVDSGDVPPGEAERAARYRTLLAGRRMLVLLDNARDSEQVRPLLAGGPGCAVLVTSRDALTGLVVRHGARRINLDSLPRDEAVKLLGVLIGDRVEAEPAAAAALAERCVRLPLALRLVAELAGSRSEASLAELDGELADIRHRLDRLDAGGEPRTASRAVFSWSYQHLSPPLAQAFRLLGVFPGHEFDAYAMAALAATDLDRAGALLAGLVGAHLVQPVGGRYGMHDLLRAYAVERAAEDPERQRRAALGRLLDYQLYACSVAMDLIAPFDRDRRPEVADPGWPLPELNDRTAAFAWLDLERPNLVAAAVHAADNGWPSQPSRLAAVLIRYLDTCAHHDDAELLHSRAAQTAAPADRAHALTSLAIVCWRRGRYQEALGHQERALEMATRAGDEAALGRALIGLGILYWHVGRTSETLRCGERALALYRRAGDRIGQGRVLGNLGIVHGRLGNYATAVEHHRQALELFRAAGDRTGIGNELCNLGSVLAELGRLDEATEQLREALTLSRQTINRECEVDALRHLGTVRRQLGRHADALNHLHEALALCRRMGGRHAEATVLSQLGCVHEELDEHACAVDHQRQALSIAVEIGDDHLSAEVLNRLGDALLGQAKPVAAMRAYRRALRITSSTGNRYEQAHAHRGIARTLGASPGGQRHWKLALALYSTLGVPEAEEVRAQLVARDSAHSSIVS